VRQHTAVLGGGVPVAGVSGVAALLQQHHGVAPWPSVRGMVIIREEAQRMRAEPSSHLRIARPSRDLEQAERFWVDGLGLEVLYRTGAEAEDGNTLLMLGWPQAAWHLELVGDPSGQTPPASTDEDLLVLYLGGPVDEGAVGRLVRAGGQHVKRTTLLGPALPNVS